MERLDRRLIPLAGITALLVGCLPPEQRALYDGASHYRAGRFTDAAETFSHAPTDARAVAGRGNAQYRLAEWNEAVARFTEASDLDSSKALRPTALYNLGNARLMQARWADSLSRSADEEAKALRIEGDDVALKLRSYVRRDSLRTSSRSMQHLVDSALAQGAEAYRKALRQVPGDEDARHNLAAALRLIAARPKPGSGDKGDGNDKDKELTEKARLLIQQADELVEKYRFKEALDLLEQGLKQEPSLKNRKEYMDKLTTVNKAASAT